MGDRSNWLERNPRKTIAVVIIVCFLMLDVLAGNVYRWITRHPWADEASFRVEQIEKTYRIAADPYHHDLAKSVSVDNARYGPISYRIRTNSLGFKDRSPRDVPLASDQHRLLFIGDSFTEGIAVDYPNTFVGIIDSALSERGIEVLNAGVAGYSPIIYWRKIKYLVENVGLKFDELVVFLDLSDAQDEAKKFYLDDNENVQYVESLSSKPVSRSHRSGLMSTIRENTILSYWILRTARSFWAEIFHSRPDIVDHDSSRWTTDKGRFRRYGQDGLAKMEFYMNRLLKLLQEHNIPLTVAVYPWPGQIYYGESSCIQVTYWEKWCQQNGVQFLNCFPYFFEGKFNNNPLAEIKRDYIKGDYHFSAIGHRLIADAFLDYYGKNN